MYGRVIVRNTDLWKMLDMKQKHSEIKLTMNLGSLCAFRVPEKCFEECIKIFRNCTPITEEKDE